jgi:hypothetical protein
MIPIECPKCGRGGSVPPDRLNARLVCKACHTVFHLDNTGRMVMGEPESYDMKTNKSRDEVSSMADFDFAQTWNDIPAAIKFGIPGVLLAVLGWIYLAPATGGPDYLSNAESIARSVASNDKSRAVSYATTDSADAAGQWFDLIQGELKKNDIGSDITVNPALFSGNADSDSEITLLVVVTKASGAGAPVTITMPMKKDGSSWKFEGNKGLEDAARASAKNKK